MADQPAPEGGPKPAPVVIKKYANRRLYNTATSAYVTLDHLSTDGEGEDRLRGLRRQDRRGHHAPGADPDHLRGREQGRPDAAADPLPAPADLVLRRQPAGRGAAVSRDVDDAVRAQPGADAQLPAECVRLQPVPAVRIDGQAEHGDVRERHADVQSVRRRPGRHDAAAPGQANGSAEPPKPDARPLRRAGSDAAIDDLKRKLDELQSQLSELSKKP